MRAVPDPVPTWCGTRCIVPWCDRESRARTRSDVLQLGEGAIVHSPDRLFGTCPIAVCAHSAILAGTDLSVETAWTVLTIGDRVRTRPSARVSASEPIVIEDDVIIGALSSGNDLDHPAPTSSLT